MDMDNNIEEIIKEAQKKEVKELQRLRDRYGFYAPLTESLDDTLLWWALKNRAKRKRKEADNRLKNCVTLEDQAKFLKKILDAKKMMNIANYKIDEQEMRSSQTWAKKLDGEELIKLIEEKTDFEKGNAERLFNEMFNVDGEQE